MTPILKVLDPGLSTTIQDAGRHAYQRYGVSVAGVLDVSSFATANHLVRNAPGSAVLELTMRGGTYEVMADAITIALTGATMPLTADGMRLDRYRSHRLGRGARVQIGMATEGVRSYLAVHGGVAVEPVLGSRSTHVRSAIGGLGGRALREGDEIPLDADCAQDLSPLKLRDDKKPYLGGIIRIVAGPQDDLFDADALTLLTHARYRMSPQSDRMAALLTGPPLPFRDGYNIVSDGVVTGSIQVPGHGRPLVLLSDRQTTGGYPKIATVTTADLGRLAQRRPNEIVRFCVISADEAEMRYLDWRRELDAIPDWLREVPGSGS